VVAGALLYLRIVKLQQLWLCYQVAVKADKLLAKCFPSEALEFYKNMADAAIRFGTSRDLAVIQGLVGMAVTIGAGENNVLIFNNNCTHSQ
jgi:hypothetical protein